MKKILCIEDEKDIRETICEELMDAGFEVIEACNGREGLDAILKHEPNLVLCDINMPVMDGSALLMQLRENYPDLAEVPFVFLSANADRRFVVAGKELGADDYLTKPIDFDLLIATINARLGQVERIKEKHQRQLIQTQKMEAIGRLTSGVAHEFNNLLTAIRGFSEIASRNLDKKDLVKECLEDVIDAADQAAGVTSQLLSFSRRQYCERRVVSANSIIDDTWRLLNSMVGPKVKLEFSSFSEPIYCEVDPKVFSQVIINLALNARDAMPDGGMLKIKTGIIEIDEETALGFSEFIDPGRYVCFTISDNGTGIEEGVIDDIFEPFFTTKDVNQGTGLGLSVAYGIIRQANGIIDCQTVLGEGTTFRVLVPETTNKPPALEPVIEGRKIPSKRVSHSKSTRAETILIVDDEKAVCNAARLVLEENGYRVLTACGEESAIEAVKNCPQRIDLLLCDVLLPELDGPALVESLGSSVEGKAVIFMSGDLNHVREKYFGLQESNPFLEKPFKPNELEDLVSKTLQGQA